jgi:hypothetical protein
MTRCERIQLRKEVVSRGRAEFAVAAQDPLERMVV